MDPKGYTFEQVARHNGEFHPEFWIVIRGIVYDVTDFMTKHPGGVELIAERAGTDATSAFEDLGHSSDAKKILKKYEIGFLAEAKSEKKDDNDAKRISTKTPNSKQRRKFLRLIVGRCASV